MIKIQQMFFMATINLVPRAFSLTISTIFKWRLVGRRPWQRLDHVVQNRQKSRRFLSCDILRKAKTQNGAKFSYR